MRYLLAVLLAAAPAYILGSVNGAISASKLFYRADIREFGSGNPGLTNFYRVYGRGGALLVIAVDAMKTIFPVLFGGWLFGRWFNMSLLGRAISGLFTILGHCFPLYYRFKGGKGILAAGTFIIVFDWRIALVLWSTFVVVVALTRYVSLASIIGASALPPTVFFLNNEALLVLIPMTLCSVLLIARHHANIKRLLQGTESKLSLRRKV